MMWSKQDIAWAAGLLEGEGCFRIKKYKHAPNAHVLEIVCKMTDEDVLKNLQIKIGGTIRKVNRTERWKPQYKDQWTWTLYGKETVYAFIVTIYKYMGIRRRKRIRELIEAFKTTNHLESYYRFIHNDGTIFEGKNLSQFCRDKGYTRSMIWKLKTKQIEKYKGLSYVC